ncbi:hypothetical protein V6N13_059507 [Hibiscus sabdariffa]
MTKGMSRTETTGPAQAGNLGCGKAVTSSLPLSQEYFPHKANYCCIFLAAETLLLPIPRRNRFGPGFGAFLVQCFLEEYADLIELPVVFSLSAEVGASAGT